MSTPYRNEIDALRERKASLEGEIAKLRDQTTRLDELRARETELARELAGVEGRLSAGMPKRALPMLDQVRVASPCTADWNEMLGDERVRFCLSCEKNVYNLSSMAKDDAEALLRDRLGDDLCVRFFQRTDGTILTQDCPVGVTKKRRKKLALAVAGAGAMAAAAATMFFKETCTTGVMQGGAMVQGEMVATDPPSPVPPVAPIPTTVPTVDLQPQGRWTAGGIGAPPAQPPPVRKTMGKPTVIR